LLGATEGGDDGAADSLALGCKDGTSLGSWLGIAEAGVGPTLGDREGAKEADGCVDGGDAKMLSTGFCDGPVLGTSEGVLLGTTTRLGAPVGPLEGARLGKKLGELLGPSVGTSLGAGVDGTAVGRRDGATDDVGMGVGFPGKILGFSLGFPVGLSLGITDGIREGRGLGKTLGEMLGPWLGASLGAEVDGTDVEIPDGATDGR
jgi:hypothetical protein